MTKTLKSICALLVCAVLTFTLASCSAQKKYEKMAEKIRVAEAKEEPLTYEEVVDKLGQPTVNGTISALGSGATGICVWYAGCESTEEFNEKLDNGKEVAYISVTFAKGKATNAEAGVKTPSEK